MIREFPLEFAFQCYDCSNTIVINVFLIKKNKPAKFICGKCKSNYKATLKMKSYEQLERPFLEVEATPYTKK